MSKVYISCVDQELEITEAGTIASGGVNEVEVDVKFSSEWDGFIKMLVCYQSKKDVYHQVMENDSCTIPWEVMAKQGTLNIGVIGISGNVTRTSNLVKLKIVEGAITTETAVPDPTPDIWQQMLTLYHIGDNGNWYVGDQDTGVSAVGPKGDPGTSIEKITVEEV